MDYQNLVYCILGLMLLLCGIKDLFTGQISILIAGVTGFLMVILIPFRMDMPLLTMAGGSLIGVSLMGISKVTRGQIGFGDGIIFCVTGLGLGFWQNLCLLLYGLSLSAVFSAFIFIFKSKNGTQAFPFVPFVCIGYVGILLL